MMTGTLGMVMWLMMGLMVLGLAAGGIASVRQRLHPHGRSGRLDSDETPAAPQGP
jgi:hypothetical protein